VIKVTNQGEPIDPKKLATIFEPLVHLAKEEARDYTRDTNLGIGLFICSSRDLI